MELQSGAVQAQRVIVVSDVHVDEWPHELPDHHQDKRQAFLEFLRWIGNDTDVQHLVINGALLDVPQKDGRPLLPEFSDIVGELAALHHAGVGISYVVGNHDAGSLGFATRTHDTSLTFNCPCLLLECGENRFAIEHGHLLDAWLWAYVEHRLSLLPAQPHTTARQAMQQFLRPVEQAGQIVMPRSDVIAQQMLSALQWEPNGLLFTDAEKRIAVALMALNLRDDFEDVRANGEQFVEQEIAVARLSEMELTTDQLQRPDSIPDRALELFFTLGDVYYAKIPWRRAARYRLKQLNSQSDAAISAIILGHVHKLDHMQWEEDGAQRNYYNDGSWKADRADFLYIEDGRVTIHERLWTDPLP